MAEKEPLRQSRGVIATSELVIIVAILSFLFAVLIPSVNAAREHDGAPPVWPFMVQVYAPNPRLFIFLFPLLTTTLFAGLLLGLLTILPQWIRDRFPWTLPPKPDPEPIDDSRPAVISPVIAACGSALLVFAASHVRADRTHRSRLRRLMRWAPTPSLPIHPQSLQPDASSLERVRLPQRTLEFDRDAYGEHCSNYQHEKFNGHQVVLHPWGRELGLVGASM